MRTTPLIFLGTFICSWVCLFVFFWNSPNTFLMATSLAPLVTLVIALPLVIVIDRYQSFQEKPYLAILLAIIFPVVGAQIWPTLYVAVPILLLLAVFFSIAHRDEDDDEEWEWDGGDDVENIANWSNELLVKKFKRASTRNGDRFAIFVEVEKRGLTKDLKIKPNSVIFEIINREGSDIPLWICAISIILNFILITFHSQLFIGTFLCIMLITLLSALFRLGGSTCNLIITNSNVVIKRTIFNRITISSKKMSITTHNNSGLYFSTSLMCSYLHKSEIALAVMFTFKRVPVADEKLAYYFSDGFFNALSTHNKPLKNTKNNLLGHSMVVDFLDIIPQSLSQLLLIRKVPFFCEQMPSGNPIFDDGQLPSSDDIAISRSVDYEMCSLMRPTIETPDFKSFCETLALPATLTRATLGLYDLDWLRILFFVQKGTSPLSLSEQGLDFNTSGDYIFSTSTLIVPSGLFSFKKDRFRAIFGTEGVTLIGQNNSVTKSYGYSEIELSHASLFEDIFDLNLPGQQLKLPYDGSLPFKQLIKFGHQGFALDPKSKDLSRQSGPIPNQRRFK